MSVPSKQLMAFRRFLTLHVRNMAHPVQRDRHWWAHRQHILQLHSPRRIDPTPAHRSLLLQRSDAGRMSPDYDRWKLKLRFKNYNNGKQGIIVGLKTGETNVVTLTNNTIVNNQNVCSFTGAGISASTLTATNNILYKNGGNETLAGTYTYNAIQAATVTGTGNIAITTSDNSETAFNSPTATTGIIADPSSDWSLGSGSVCLNAGTGSGSTDVAGNTRIQQTTIDLGAYETSLASGATPTISSTGTLSGLSTTYGTASSSTSFSVSGADMTEGISVNPPVGFQVSTASDFSSNVGTNGSPITVGTAGTISATTVYVRILATATVGSYSGNIVLSSAYATSVNVATVSSTVAAATANKTGGNIDALGLTDPELANTDITLTSGELVVNTGKTVRSITVNAGANLSVADGQTLTLTNLTLKSNVSGTSTYVPTGTLKNGTVTVTGTTAVEQYLTYTRNYYVSSPVSNAVAPENYTYYSRYEPGGTASGWSPVSVGDDLVAGKGYIALPTSAGAPITFSSTSPDGLNNGNITIPLTYTAEATSGKGYNLIGNPYPSHLSWTYAFTQAKVDTIESSIWYRTKAANGNSGGGWSFVTFNPTSELTVPSTENGGLIPPMQAFWVLAKRSGSIQLNNDMRSHQTGNPLRSPAAKSDYRKKLRLQVSNGTTTDEALIVFDANATDGYDAYDSPKMMNNATDIADIYTVTDAKKLVINGLNSVKFDTEIPVGFGTLAAGNFSILANEFSNFEAGTRLFLKDTENPTAMVELSAGTAYNFSAPITAANANRFSLLFRAPGSSTGIENVNKLNAQVYVNAANQITIVAPEKSNFAIYNAVGMLVDSGQTTAKLHTANCKLQTGIYVIRLSENGKELTTRVIVK